MISEKRIMIFGSNGMFGQRITEYYQNNVNVKLFCSSAEEESFFAGVTYKSLDITDEDETGKLILEFSPDVIINAAAYTAVDKAEIEKDICRKINKDAVANLARYAKRIDAQLINISTDYIFNGENGPYSEDHETDPVGFYGLTKLEGEQEIIQSGCRYTILRTNVLYGPAKYGRPDFVKWVVSSLKEGNEIRIVTDQVNNPTFIDDLVSAAVKSAETGVNGIFNTGSEEFLSRFDFTLRIADYFNLDKNLIKPISTSELNQPARRPLKSGLILDKIKNELNYRPHSLEDSFRIMKEELKL